MMKEKIVYSVWNCCTMERADRQAMKCCVGCVQKLVLKQK